MKMNNGPSSSPSRDSERIRGPHNSEADYAAEKYGENDLKNKKREKLQPPAKKYEEKEPTQKGYNEKNPSQPQGAFIADSNSKKL